MFLSPFQVPRLTSKFHEKYLKRGLLGGQEAADEFMSKIKEYVGSLESIERPHEIVVKAYANLSGLAQACVRDGRLGNLTDLTQFWVGFSRRYPQVDVVDVGSGKEEADNKIRGRLTPYVTKFLR